MSIKRLRSVVQSIGHHAVSGLCHVHPHLADACKAAGLTSAGIDLLTGRVRLDGVDIPQPLELGSRALSKRFEEILAAENMHPDLLVRATAEFQFRGSRWPASCYVSVDTSDGKTLEDAIASSGERAELVRGPA